MGTCNYFSWIWCTVLSWIIINSAAGTTLYNDIDDTRNSKGLFPNVFNLAATSNITANATCGETKTGAEIYCKLVEHVLLREDEKRGHVKSSREPQCGVCNSTNSSPDKRHPISNAIDGTNRWWQSPTLQNGKQFEWVTIALDLGEVYQVAYVIVKAAISPRPGNWILERSIDGIIYKPWQYYALSDSECWETYGIRPTIGKPRYRTDDEVICTSYYSKLNPLENGEIHTSLVNGRPGVDGPSMKLREFTKARYVRLRLQKIRTLNADLMTLQSDEPERIDKSVTRRYFYSIKDISIGGQCVCSGHAESCSSDASTGKQRCICEHSTCGENCERCCPLFNQKPWRPGTSLDAAACEKCECYGHAETCHYEQEVADKRQSIGIDGKYEGGGGVCDNCKHHTAGINCERCEDGYYRPANIPRNHSRPCKKCQCNGPGMTGICVKDDSHRIEGLPPHLVKGKKSVSTPMIDPEILSMQAGDCLCKPGFTGKKCDRCAVGYRNYPSCDPCPCHSAGTVGGTTCDGDCVCKVHVEGHRCEKCKPGYYHLSADNPDGCSQCFCFGNTDECTEGDWGVELIEKMEDWRVTDIRGRRVVRPTLYNGNLVIAYDEVSQFNTYYWLAPPDYLGKKLYSYGADVKFTVSYVVARGDTSGTYIEGAVLILEGNGDQFGYDHDTLPESEPSTVTMHLREQGWFHTNPSGDNIGSVSREAFTLALNNVTRILIRAKFHTDQIEGRLHNIGMEIASKESKSLKKLESVEKCVCPPGYAGLSCEMCAPGYRQVGSHDGIRIICQRCDCYNHAESCDADTGRCRNCLHNTTGLKCDRCVRGYYGDATVGTLDDCKPCACPLEIPENNFSPSCTAVSAGSDYVCDRCSDGFEGDKCESCAEGYFGNPQIPGGYCQPCECSGNADTSQPGWCDRLTGQCLKCLGNTGGWNCGECLSSHYGNPERQQCEPCSCNNHGSVSSQCDHSTGQCICKTRFVGRTCNRCADGFGNVETGCEPCKCNRVGSRTESCDPVTGICLCKPGVFGVACDSCLEGHYGFSRQGCLECNCSPLGSFSPQCDENSGQCSCKAHVTGRACDRCEDGYWNINTGQGCEECQCNRTGSVASLCDKNTGQCSCKTGAGGKYCDQCLPGYYKFTARGCRKCDPCDIPGHICDPNNGRCVCPPYTTGRRCQMCVQNAWGYNPLTGCTPCNCNIQGSPSQTCDSNTGNCVCLEGFEGRLCDQCRHGFYNFPSCFKCDCNVAGTDTTRCQLKDGICQCNERGQCICKENVMGQKCMQCTEGAFGLSAENPKGCHQCFCFGRTPNCNQATMAWSRVPFQSSDVFMEIGTSEIPTVLGFQVVPSDLTGRRLGIPYVLDKPLYWNLPKEALGDKVLSYNGFLTFHVETHGQSHFPDALLQRYPLVVLQGNHRIVLVHYPPAEKLRGPYRVRMYENEWKMRDNPQVPVRKEDLMVALQNVQTILIRATDGPDVKYARLHNVSLDIAVTSYQSSAVAEGIEMCRCPRQYVAASCQDPAPGFYRKRKPNYLDSKDVLDLVGWAEPCSCNNHTNICDRETGVCIDCTGNTMGPNCDQCIKGFYGDPMRGPCRPCACPHPTNSFSDTCVPDAVDYVCIDCQTGYSGRHCERCASGFYGDPLREGGRCLPCNCNVYGSQRRDCDQNGQCTCHEGISGRDCTVCSHGFILTEYGCKSCGDECTGILLNELFQLQQQLDRINVSDIPRLPWGYLNKMSRAEQELRPLVTEYQRKVALGKELVDDFTFRFDLEAVADMLYVKAKDYITKATMVSTDAKETLDEAEKLLRDLQKIRRSIEDLKNELDRYGTDPTGPILSVEGLLREARRILSEIRSRNFDPDKTNAERELRKALNLLNNVKKLTMDHGLLDDLNDRINVLSNLLDDITRRIDDNVRKPARRALAIIQTSRSRNNEVKEIVGGISGTIDNCNATLKEAADLLGQARSDVIIAAVKFQFLPRYVSDLENATDKLDERRSILARLNPQYKDQYVIPAQRHADELERQSLDLNNLFSATRELSELPIEAAKAYQNIVDAINAAEIAAIEAAGAADTAYQQAYPERGDALVDQAKKAKERSTELLIEAQKLNEIEIPVLEGEMRARKKDLDKLGRDITHGRRDNDIIKRELDALPKGVSDSLSNIEAEVQVAKQKADAADNKVDRIIRDIENDLKPKLESVKAGTVGGLENITRMIQQAQEEVKVASRLADSADASAQRVSKQNSIMRLNLKELKDKILLARQKASSIRVALTADKDGKCARSFKPLIEPSTTNNIVLNYAIKSDKPNSMLFFLGSAEQEDFMAIEMVSRKIRFLWNAGGGTQVIEHSRTIETNNEQLLKNEQWFKIEVNRIGNLATLSVKRTPDGQKPDPSEVTGASPAGFTKMDLDSKSTFFIGGFPEDYVKPSDMRTSSFAGCLYEVILDGKPVGLWNFISSEGCDGCKEGATEEIDISAYDFQGGNSYAIMPQIPYYRKSDLYIALSFKTLNEDGLLLFAGNPKSGDFISLELKEGKIVYQLKFGGRSHILLTTSKKYNTGNWVRVEAARDRYEAQMHVEDEKLEDLGSKQGPSVLDLQRMPIYFGGVPPNFTLERWPGITFTSYFGCLKDMQIDSTPFALSRGSFYGMAVGCSNRPVRAGTFKGSGFLELNSQPILSDSSFALSFFTNQKDALLLVSTFSGQDADEEKLQNYYSISVKDGKIEARFNSGSGEISMVSDQSLTPGVFHTVNVIRKNRKLSLSVDDVEEAEIRLSRGARDISAPQTGGLFLGGVKEGVSIDNMVASPQKLIGIITDVVFNDRLLRFENTVGHRGVDFGQPDVSSVSVDFFQQMALSYPSESCYSSYALLEKDTISFSGTQDFLQYNLAKKELSQNFNVSFEFRTFHENGVLFAVKNEQKKQQLVVYVRENYILVDFRRKKGEHKNILSSNELSHGEWHMVGLVKSGKVLSLYLNQKKIASTHIPKKLAFKNPLYIGGMPAHSTSQVRMVSSSYHGCIRNVVINGDTKKLPGTDRLCFSHVDRGLYFTGKGYATYDLSFNTNGKQLVVNVLFRTTQVDGVLLSFHDEFSGLWFKLQLLDGEVVTTIYQEKSSRMYKISSSFDSRYDMCDNKWHSVMTAYKASTLTLALDRLKSVHREVEKFPLEFKPTNLYIGGTPKKYRHLFASEHDFVGCLQSLSVNGQSINFERVKTNSRTVHHSCPQL